MPMGAPVSSQEMIHHLSPIMLARDHHQGAPRTVMSSCYTTSLKLSMSLSLRRQGGRRWEWCLGSSMTWMRLWNRWDLVRWSRVIILSVIEEGMVQWERSCREERSEFHGPRLWLGKDVQCTLGRLIRSMSEEHLHPGLSSSGITLADSIRADNSLTDSIVYWKSASSSLSFLDLCWLGTILTTTDSLRLVRRASSVAKRVQKVSLRRNNINPKWY